MVDARRGRVSRAKPPLRCPVPCYGKTMLTPIENEYRRLIALDGIWDFCLDAEDRGVADALLPRVSRRASPDAGTGELTTTSRSSRRSAITSDRSGTGAAFTSPPSGANQRSCSASARPATTRPRGSTASEVADHRGGFLPFEGDLGSAVRFGATNELVVRVDNRLDWTTLPPGKLSPAGTKRPGYTGQRLRQDYFLDFFNYAGIHRSVQVQRLPKQRIVASASRPASSPAPAASAMKSPSRVVAR